MSGEEEAITSAKRTRASFLSVHEERRLREKEREILIKTEHNLLFLFFINSYSSIVVFFLHLISLESLLGIVLTVGFTVYVYEKTDNDADWNGSSMDWVILSFAIVSPMSATLAMAFQRRERALGNIARLLALLANIYVAHANWDWRTSGVKVSGRAASPVVWVDHADEVMRHLVGIGDDVSRFLAIPNPTRSRHRVTKFGRREALETLAYGKELYGFILLRLSRLSQLAEVLKQEGLNPGEAARLRKWERLCLEEIEGLRMIKMYRTPQALRSFARLFSVLLPPFYAPYYAQLARDVNSLGVGIAYAVVVSVALTALFESVTQLEDPFVMQLTLDGIDIELALSNTNYERLLALRNKAFFPHARPYPPREVSRRSEDIGKTLGRNSARLLHPD